MSTTQDSTARMPDGTSARSRFCRARRELFAERHQPENRPATYGTEAGPPHPGRAGVTQAGRSPQRTASRLSHKPARSPPTKI